MNEGRVRKKCELRGHIPILPKEWRTKYFGQAEPTDEQLRDDGRIDGIPARMGCATTIADSLQADVEEYKANAAAPGIQNHRQ
jgi:hypothetical protein